MSTATLELPLNATLIALDSARTGNELLRTLEALVSTEEQPENTNG